jgi:hypothetical protein
MQRLVGPGWAAWSTEQVASNFFIANAPHVAVLPYPKYACFEPQVEAEKASFLHFYGTYRFDGGVYQSKAKAAIEKLRSTTMAGTGRF